MLKQAVNARVYAALYLSKKTALEKVNQANYIVTQMTAAGPVFTNPDPSLTSVSSASSDLALAIEAASSNSDFDKLDLAQKENVLDTLMIRLKEYAQNVANSQNNSVVAANILASGGFTLAKSPEKNPAPLPVTGLVAVFTNQAGKILVKWEKAQYARTKEVFITTTPNEEASWKFVGSTTKRKLMVENLASNTHYYFRVVSVGSGGISVPSNVVDNITNMS